jgi:hypothetical protein
MSEMILIERDQLEMILNALANQKFVNDLNGRDRKEKQMACDKIWNDGMLVLNKKDKSLLTTLINEVMDEYISANTKYKMFNSLHEAYAVLLEEVDELWDEIKKKPNAVSSHRVHEESIQIAAMAIKLLMSHYSKAKLLI